MNLKTKLISLMARKLAVRPARLAGHRPVASISFDDFPKNAWTQGGPVMARHGVRGTYYTAGGFCGRSVDGMVFYDADDLKALAAAGHEIACHGFGHQPTPALTNEELTEDATRNREFLRPFLNGEAPVSYAFPYGRVSPRTKRFFAPRFASLRGVHPGINAGRVDLAQLNTISLETRCWNQGEIEAAIQRALHDHGWLIFYTHDVADTPSPWGCTPGLLRHALDAAKRRNMPMVSVAEALRRAGA